LLSLSLSSLTGLNVDRFYITIWFFSSTK
jgi:hypothetical protein